MHFLNTLSNSFVLGEKNDKGVVTKQLGFPKGGLTYLIENNNVKFFLKEDYFYRNLVFSADAPFLIDGILVSAANLPIALKKIFHQEAEGSVVDTEFNTESFNAIANSPVSIRFNEIEGVQDVISGNVGTLSGEVQTKADRSEIPDVSNFIEMSAVTDYTYDKQTIDTKIENVEVDAYTKQESDARFQPIGDYLTKASGDTIYQPIGDYATRSEIPSVVGYADSVKYNSTTKYVEFYHGGTGGTKVFEYDAAPFLIDGMVQNVEIINGNLVISFNTDAGKQDITIPLTDIFDPSNYYDKTAIDGLLANKVNTSTFNTYSAATDELYDEINSAITSVSGAIDDAKAYYINFMTIDSMRDEDWNGIVAAIDDHRPIYAGFSMGDGTMRYYGVEYMNKNSGNTEIVMAVSDNESHYFYTFTKNGSNDYSFTVSTKPFVTQAEKTAWNNKSDFSGDYNDLTNKPTIPTVPTNVSDFTNDAGYITSGEAATQIEAATSGKADTTAVTEAISSAVSGKVNTSTYNAYTAATDVRIDDIDNAKAYYISFATIATTGIRDEDWNGIVAAIDAHRPIYAGYPRQDGGILYYGVECMNKNVSNTEIVMTASDNSQHYFYTFTKNGSNDYSYTVETREYVSQAEKAAWNAKQDALSAGTGIEISGNVISATGGGGSTYSAGTNISIANDTINCTLPISANTSNKNVTVGYDLNVREEGETSIGKFNVNRYERATAHSGNTIFTVGNGGSNGLRHNALEIRKNGDLYFADTSNNGQSYYEKPMVRLQDMYAALGGLKLVKLTQAEYDALATKDNSTLYVIVD